MHLLDIVTIVVIGLMVGTELTVSLFINPVLSQLDAAEQARGLSLFARRLGRAMPLWYALCLIFLIAETALRRSTPAFAELLAAAVLWALTIAYTILLLVPINNRIAALNMSAPLSHWINDHKRWDRLHRLRILLLLISLVLVVHALLATA